MLQAPDDLWTIHVIFKNICKLCLHYLHFNQFEYVQRIYLWVTLNSFQHFPFSSTHPDLMTPERDSYFLFLLLLFAFESVSIHFTPLQIQQTCVNYENRTQKCHCVLIDYHDITYKITPDSADSMARTILYDPSLPSSFNFLDNFTWSR